MAEEKQKLDIKWLRRVDPVPPWQSAVTQTQSKAWRRFEDRKIQIQAMIHLWKNDMVGVDRPRARRIALEISQATVALGEGILTEFALRSDTDIAFMRSATGLADGAAELAEELWRDEMGMVNIEPAEAQFFRRFVRETTEQNMRDVADRIVIDRLKRGRPDDDEAEEAQDFHETVTIEEAEIDPADVERVLYGRDAAAAPSPDGTGDAGQAPVRLPAARAAELPMDEPDQETGIDRIKTVIIELRREGLTFLEIADRLGNAERPAKTEWKELPWPRAIRDPNHKNSVMRWISGVLSA